MARDERLCVFCYDISSDRRRRRVARILEEEASRVQYSVFEARLTASKVKLLEARIEAILDENDSLRVYSIGAVGERYCQVIGAGVPVEKETGFWLF